MIGSCVCAVQSGGGGFKPGLAAANINDLVVVFLLGHINAYLDRTIFYNLLLDQTRVLYIQVIRTGNLGSDIRIGVYLLIRSIRIRIGIVRF